MDKALIYLPTNCITVYMMVRHIGKNEERWTQCADWSNLIGDGGCVEEQADGQPETPYQSADGQCDPRTYFE